MKVFLIPQQITYPLYPDNSVSILDIKKAQRVHHTIRDHEAAAVIMLSALYEKYMQLLLFSQLAFLLPTLLQQVMEWVSPSPR